MTTNSTMQQRIKIGEIKWAHSGAQAITLIAYGDLPDLPVRNLHYSAECDDFEDFAACLRIIQSYNDFTAVDILETASHLLSQKRYWNDGNPNNDRDMFFYKIARESSPCFYIKYNGFLSPKRKINGEVIEYTQEDFKADMKQAQSIINADEFNIEQDTEIGCTVRFWFD